MSVAVNIQSFIKNKLKEFNISRKQFIQESGISSSVVSGLLNAMRVNPTLKCLIKIANYFNCTIDEVLGRKHYSVPLDIDKTMTYNDIVNNIYDYIRCRLEAQNITANKLSQLCGIGENTILKSLKEHKTKGNLGTKSLVAIADYFDVSIDDMAKRLIHNKD